VPPVTLKPRPAPAAEKPAEPAGRSGRRASTPAPARTGCRGGGVLNELSASEVEARRRALQDSRVRDVEDASAQKKKPRAAPRKKPVAQPKRLKPPAKAAEEEPAGQGSR
jgi:translation initiation factor IF-2